MPTQTARIAFRENVIRTFSAKLNAHIVLSPEIKNILEVGFKKTAERLEALGDISKEEWSKMSTADLWRDHEEIIAELKVLNIFSDKFFQNIYSSWHNLIHSFSPNSQNFKL